jgi:SHOCT-like domain
MSEESRRVLDMLAQGKITVADAEQLLQALKEHPESGSSEAPNAAPEGEKPKPKFLCVLVQPVHGAGSRHQGPVNIRLPLGFLRSGIKLAAVMPDFMKGRVNEHLKEHGIDFDAARMKPENLDALIATLSELNLEIDSEKDKVRIFCE